MDAALGCISQTDTDANTIICLHFGISDAPSGLSLKGSAPTINEWKWGALNYLERWMDDG
jgi:hypothetical protein